MTKPNEPRPVAFYEGEGGCPSCGDPSSNNAAWEIEHYIAWAVNECQEPMDVEEEVNHIADIIAWHKKNVHRYCRTEEV